MSRCQHSKSPVAATLVLSAVLSLCLVVPGAAAADDFLIIPIPVGESATVPVADVVELRRDFISFDSRAALRRGAIDGTEASRDFVVPAGRVLVVTSIHFTPQQVSSGVNLVFVQQRRGRTLRTRRQLMFPSNTTAQLQFSPGMVFDAGSELVIENRDNSRASVRADAHGYLVDAP